MSSVCLAQTCTQTLGVGANIPSAISSAPNNATICLSAGNYGTVNLWNISRQDFVTLRSASGVSAIISPNPGNSDYIRLESLTISGSDVDSCSTHIEFISNVFTKGLIMRSDGCSPTSANNLVEGNTFNNLSPALGDGRFTIKRQSNIIVRNNTFGGGGCSDGLQIYDGSNNILIEENRFQNLQQANCGVHVDAIQLVSGQRDITITKNLFSNNSVSLGLYDGGSNLTVTDNVFVGSPRNFQMGSFQNVLIAHNTVRNEGWEFSSDPGTTQNSGVVIENNIFDNTSLTDSQGNYCGANCIQRYNLISRGSKYKGTCMGCFVADAVYSGGSSPSNYAGHELAPSSPGRNAASDGKDMGIRLATTPTQTNPGPPTQLSAIVN